MYDFRLVSVLYVLHSFKMTRSSPWRLCTLGGLVGVTGPNGIFTITFYLGSFQNLWKVVISFAITVHPSGCMKQIRSRWKGFHKFLYWGVILKSVKKIHIRLQHDDNRRHVAYLWLFWLLALMQLPSIIIENDSNKYQRISAVFLHAIYMTNNLVLKLSPCCKCNLFLFG